MPSKDSHLRIVHENTAAINWVRQAQPPMPQWVVTIAFYKALHIIEAVFAADKKSPIRHADDHAQRNDVLRREPRYSHLWKHYRPLWNDSLIARLSLWVRVDKFGLESDRPVLNTDPDKVDLAGNVSTKHQKSNINQV